MMTDLEKFSTSEAQLEAGSPAEEKYPQSEAMKVYILTSTKSRSTENLLSQIKENKQFSHVELELLSSEGNSHSFAEALLSRSMIVIPPDVDAFHFISIYIAELRVLPEALQRPLLLWDGACKAITDEFFVEYRRSLPSVPLKEADDHYIMFRKKRDDFFRNVETLEEVMSLVEQFTGKSAGCEIPENLRAVTEGDMSSIRDKFSTHRVTSEAEVFYNWLYEGSRSAVFVSGAGSGAPWDLDGRSAIYKSVGAVLVQNGYNFVNGGPDGGQDKAGPMRYSAVGVHQASAHIYSVYSALVIRKYVSPEVLSEFGENISFAVVPTEAAKKELMINKTDLTVALPGAIGTFAEIEEAIRQSKPVILCNIQTDRGYFFDNYIALLQLRNMQHHVIDARIPFDASPQVVKNNIEAALKVVQASQSSAFVPNLSLWVDPRSAASTESVVDLEGASQLGGDGFDPSFSTLSAPRS